MKVIRYEEKYKKQWDQFVLNSKNGTFLLLRDYMDYHSDRFQDASLMFFEDEHNVTALLPANLKDSTLFSHQGLTYGGFITNANMTQPSMIKLFKSLLDYCVQNSITDLTYKTIPSIYHRLPAVEDHYALFLLNATLKRRDVLTVAQNTYPIPFQSRRKRSIKKAEQAELYVKQSQDFAAYWQILEDNLKAKHGVSPVHSLDEIKLLAERFPENIKLFACFDKNETMLAGIVVYETNEVAHLQYIGASASGKESGALDFLFAELIKTIYVQKPYVDFGISNEQDGRVMNQGLIEFKEGFGGRSVLHDYYHLKLNSELLNLLPS